MLDRLGFTRHVSDADLSALWAETSLGEPTHHTAAARHVRDCSACRTRLTALSTWLDGLRTDALQEADEAFPRERLSAQHAQILRRLEALERPAKVLAFPRFSKPIAALDSGRQRWIAAAAVAGLVVGIGLGQTFDFRRLTSPDGFRTPDQIVGRVVQDRALRPVQTISLTSSTDEDLLYDQGPATARVPESLRSLHEITPSAREYEPR